MQLSNSLANEQSNRRAAIPRAGQEISPHWLTSHRLWNTSARGLYWRHPRSPPGTK